MIALELLVVLVVIFTVYDILGICVNAETNAIQFIVWGVIGHSL